MTAKRGAVPGDEIEAWPAERGAVPGDEIEAWPAERGAVPGDEIEAWPAKRGAGPGARTGMFIINIALKRGRARKRERNASARIVGGSAEVDGSRRDGRAFGERWLESGENEAEAGDVVVHQDVDRTWRALLVAEGGFLVEIRPDAADGSQWYDSARFVSFRREVSRLAELDAAGRRAEVERQRGIADERLRRTCAEQHADYRVCRTADPHGTAPTPELAAQYNRGWSRIRGRVGTLRTAEAALAAVDAALEAAEPAGRTAAPDARDGEPAASDDPSVVLNVRVPRSLLARLDERAAALGVSRGVLIRGALAALADVPLD